MGKLIRTALAATLLVASALPVEAQRKIAEPLPEHARKPLAAFLSASGWKNADALVARAQQARLTEQIFLVRVPDETTCDPDQDLCLTVIGSLRNGGFVAEAVFYAGASFEAPNNAFAFGGKEGPSLFFVRFTGKSHSVIAAPAPTGWIVIPSGDIDRFKGPAN